MQNPLKTENITTLHNSTDENRIKSCSSPVEDREKCLSFRNQHRSQGCEQLPKGPYDSPQLPPRQRSQEDRDIPAVLWTVSEFLKHSRL